jgi:NADH-quinone oxidoreductase subunit B
MACFLHNWCQPNKIATSVDFVSNRARASALWPPTFGPASCAIEMLGTPASRFDIAWSGTEVFPLGPWQSDLLIVAGAVTFKLPPVLGRICDQMFDPKRYISMGACGSAGEPSYAYTEPDDHAGKLPTDIRLDESMQENFKQQVRIEQIHNPA